VIQLLVPALVVIIAVLVLTRNRARSPRPESSSLSYGALIGLIVIGAALAIGLVWALHVESP
jgi:multisubunit Na+/H+ antiporter MnhB subunit